MTFYTPDEPLYLNLMGIDPGTTNVGIGLMRVLVPEWRVVQVAGWTLEAYRYPRPDWIIDQHDDKYARLYITRQVLFDAFRQYQPFAIGCESPFYNALRPNAYGPLVESVDAVRHAVMDYSHHHNLTMIPPMAVKKQLGHGHSDKAVVAAELDRLYGAVACRPIKTLKDHASDALAVTHCLYNLLRE